MHQKYKVIKHGGFGTKEYKCWEDIKSRINNPHNKFYHRYGGRGLSISKDFLGTYGFLTFLKHVGKAPTKKHQIDRINNELGYLKNNLRWVTPSENNRNKSTNVTYKGETAIEASIRLGGGKQLVSNRMSNHFWEIEKAFTTPVHRKGTFKRNKNNRTTYVGN